MMIQIARNEALSGKCETIRPEMGTCIPLEVNKIGKSYLSS